MIEPTASCKGGVLRRDARVSGLVRILILTSISVIGAGACAGRHVEGSGSSPAAINEFNGLQGPTRDVTVTLKEGTNLSASPSPDGKQVAFAAQGAIWIVGRQGGKARRITSFDIEATAPVWSPDGKTIAFQNYTADGNYHIWTVNTDGNNVRELTTGPYDDREPAWHPNGAEIVFSSDRSNDGQYKIWRTIVGTGVSTPVTTGPGAESNPVVSPNGKEVVFSNSSSIYTVPLSGGSPKLIGPGTIPAYSEDGNEFIFQTAGRVLTVQGNAVSGTEDVFPFPVRWLPDGKFMYTSDGKIRTRDAAGHNLEEIPFEADFSVRRAVVTKKKDHGFSVLGSQPVLGISAPAISPDGGSIAFGALNGIWVMKIGQAPTRLTTDRGRTGNPLWTPDGKSIYFSTEADNAGALAVDKIELSTGTRTRIAAIPGVSMGSPRMSPDGDRLAYVTGNGQVEIWDIGEKRRTVILAPLNSGVGRPSWTADGSKIIVVDSKRINNRFREGYNVLRVIDIATKTGVIYPVAAPPQQIADRGEAHPVVSPDGKYVAFVMDAVLHVMPLNPDGSPSGPAVPITNEASDLPSWAADSATILYKASTKIKKIRVDGSGQTEVPVNLRWTQEVGPAITIVRAGKLWDGKNDGLRNDVDITIKGNRIVGIAPHTEGIEKSAEKYIDASHLTILPGLFDAHVHIPYLLEGGQFGKTWALFLSYGITSVQSMSGHMHEAVEIREALNAGMLIGPRVFVTPPHIEGNRTSWKDGRSIRTPQIADLEIAKAKALDADLIKTYVRAPVWLMTKFAQASADMGVPSSTHSLSQGLATGIGGMAHVTATERSGYGFSKSLGGFVYQDATSLAGAADFGVVQTAFASLPLIAADPAFKTDPRYQTLVPPESVVRLESVVSATATQTAGIQKEQSQDTKFVRANVLMPTGTDYPNQPPAYSLHAGLRARGLNASNDEALKSVTITAARASYVDKDLGSIEVGKLADLIAVRGNPLEDLKAATQVEYVVKNGVSYTIPRILAPYRTKTAVTQHRQAMAAYRKLCGSKELSAACHTNSHAH